MAIEAEAIKLEVQDTRSGMPHSDQLFLEKGILMEITTDGSQDETLASTSSFPSSVDEPAAHDSDGGQQQKVNGNKMPTSKSKRGSFFHRAKRALGISSDVVVAGSATPKDHPVNFFNDNNPGEVWGLLVFDLPARILTP